MGEPVTATRAESKAPITDHLWQLGFTLKSKAERMPVPIPTEKGDLLVTTFEVIANPERGEARRLFAAKGPARAEVKSNVPIEKLLHDQERGDTALRDLYTEQCAAVLLEMLVADSPQISRPGVDRG